MPNFDISDLADFSRLTQGALGAVNSLLGGRDPKEWDIREASFNGVKFHVFSLSKQNVFSAFNGEPTSETENTNYEGAVSRVSDFSGRRKVKYSFPYRDGQTTDDLGRKGQSFEVDALIFGRRYMEGYNRLLAEFDKPTPGKLVHPVRGEIDCVIEDVTHVHQHDQRKAVSLRITFTEHNFSVGSINLLNDASVKSALTQALEVFKIIDRAIARVEAAVLFARGVKNLINSFLAVYKRDQAVTLTRMNMTFNTKGGSTDIPALLPVNLGGSGIATSAIGGASSGTVIGQGTAGGGGTGGGGGGTGGGGSGGGTGGGGTSGGGGSGGSGINGSSIVSDENFVVVRSVSDPFNGIPVADLTSTTAIAIAITELAKETQNLRDQATTIIKAINDNGGALELYDTVIELRQTTILTQAVLEKGTASSNARILNYTVPRTMSLREVAFNNGISPNRVEELDILNPSLLSINFIEKGVVLRVPAA